MPRPRPFWDGRMPRDKCFQDPLRNVIGFREQRTDRQTDRQTDSVLCQIDNLQYTICDFRRHLMLAGGGHGYMASVMGAIVREAGARG